MTAMTRSIDILTRYPYYWAKTHMDRYRNESNAERYDSYITENWDRIVEDSERYVQNKKPESDIISLSDTEQLASDYVFKRYIDTLVN